MPGFLSAAQIAGLRDIIVQGLQTASDMYDTAVQFEHVNPVTGKYAPYGPSQVELISIDFGLREVTATTGTPIQTRESDGDIKLWADGFIPEVGDRFSYNGKRVEVTAVYPAQFGFVIAEVELKQ